MLSPTPTGAPNDEMDSMSAEKEVGEQVIKSMAAAMVVGGAQQKRAAIAES